MDSDEGRWPALMDLPTAGAYLQLRPKALLRVLAREGVAPVDVGARLRRWRRRDLDEMLSRLPRQGHRPSSASTEQVPSLTDRALAAVETRTRNHSRNRRRPHEIREPHPKA